MPSSSGTPKPDRRNAPTGASARKMYFYLGMSMLAPIPTMKCDYLSPLVSARSLSAVLHRSTNILNSALTSSPAASCPFRFSCKLFT
jgi:hypothetical protein